MPLLKNINLNGTLLEIEDTTARTNAENAQNTADTALSKATAAQNTADSKALITYTESEMTMYIK